MLRIESKAVRTESRVIVISDIHGDLELFQKLLYKIEFNEHDVLFINGDICEKGPNSLGAVRYVMNLVSKKVYVTKGNCDILIKHVFQENEGIIEYMRNQPNSILNEMLEEQGKFLEDFSSLVELADFYQQYYSKEVDWLLNLPDAYETEDYLIIHAGVENIENWQETSRVKALSIPTFYEKGHQVDKIVIVGHWPVINYTSMTVSSDNPIIDLDQKMINIDGGNQVKSFGQLNALIIENGEYTFTSVDHVLQKRTIRMDFDAPAEYIGTVTYPNYEMKVLIQEKHFTLCENINLGIQHWIKNEYLVENGEGTYCKNDLSTTLLSVRAGEVVSILDDTCEGYVLIKRNGELGWVPEDVIHI
ncbi:metallophosphoesterase [Pseudoneobacillus sp. C159]